MKQKETPYIAHCSFCKQGLLRFMRCRECDAVIAICDECELTWRNIASVHSNPRCPSSGSFPAAQPASHPKHAGRDSIVPKWSPPASRNTWQANRSERCVAKVPPACREFHVRCYTAANAETCGRGDEV